MAGKLRLPAQLHIHTHTHMCKNLYIVRQLAPATPQHSDEKSRTRNVWLKRFVCAEKCDKIGREE